jgi:HPt (histidine-containing phosphotransfer) domain-containing protein
MKPVGRTTEMNVQECYEAMGGDYADVQSRLRTDERIRRFLLKIPSDPSYQLLCDSLEKGDVAETFRAAHTLKGISQNLSLTRFYHSSAALSDYLKPRQDFGDQIEPLVAAVKADYAVLLDSIQKLQEL